MASEYDGDESEANYELGDELCRRAGFEHLTDEEFQRLESGRYSEQANWEDLVALDSVTRRNDMGTEYEPEIVEAGESKLAWVKLLITGLSGSGKTTLLATADDALILQCEEQGIHSLRAMKPKAKIIHIKSWDHLSQTFGWILKKIAANDFPYRTICLDSIHDAQDLFAKKLMAGSADKVKLTMDEFGLLASRTLMLLDTIKRMPRHAVVVTKAEEFVDGEDLKVRPGGLGKKAPENMPYYFNVVGYCFKRLPEAGGRPEYFVLTDGHDKYVTKGHPALNPTEVQNVQHWIDKMLSADFAGVLKPAVPREGETAMPPTPAEPKKPGQARMDKAKAEKEKKEKKIAERKAKAEADRIAREKAEADAAAAAADEGGE